MVDREVSPNSAPIIQFSLNYSDFIPDSKTLKDVEKSDEQAHVVSIKMDDPIVVPLTVSITPSPIKENRLKKLQSYHPSPKKKKKTKNKGQSSIECPLLISYC